MTNEMLADAPEPGTHARASSDIAFITRHLVPYWAEALDELAKAWSNHGKLHVICGETGEDELHPWPAESSKLAHAVLRVFPPQTRFHLFGTVWPSRAIWDFLEEIKPTLVILHEYSPYVLLSGLLWARAAERPCIVVSDVGPEQRLQLSPLQRLIHHLVNASVEGVLARTEDALNSSRIASRSGLLAPHAISADFYQNARLTTRAPRRLIQVGSLIHRKGIDLLMRAFRQALDTRPDLHLTLVGAGNHSAAWELARSLGISNSLAIRDFLPPSELRREYLEADAFVLASRFDSFGVVVHEAAASGLPLILSKHVGAAATLVERGVNGFIIDPENSEEFSEALRAVLDSECNRRMSEASSLIARKYDVSVVAQKTAAWLRQITSIFPVSRARPARALSGLWRTVAHVLKRRADSLQSIFVPDMFCPGRRDLVLINRYAPFYRQGILTRLAERYSLRILYSGKTLGNLRSVENLESVAVPVLESGKKSNRKIFWIASTFQLLLTRPSVLITEFSLSLLSTWVLFALRPILGFRLIFWAHGFQDFGWKCRRLTPGDRLRLIWMNWADAMVFYSQDRRDEAAGLTRKSQRFFVAPNAVDTSQLRDAFFQCRAEGKSAIRAKMCLSGPTLAFVGRLTADKEVLQLPILLRMLETIGVSASLLVVGGGELERDLSALCHPFGDRIRLLGPIFDPLERSRIIYSADVLVSPGYVGLNVVDSLALGRPVATFEDHALIKRHSPEFSYLKAGYNAIISPSMEHLASDLAALLRTGVGISASEAEIQEHFQSQCSIERQLAGLEEAIAFVLKK